MARWQFQKGLQDLGNGCFAYLQPDGSWGWSNAGLVTDGEASLLVDTLFDLHLTGDMLETMRKASPAAARIDSLVNTHANGDHCYGNALVEGAEIIASRASAEEMDEVPPAMLAQLLENADALGPAGAYFRRIFGDFDFAGIGKTAAPTRTFEGELEVAVGGKAVRLLEVGPAHTRGDVLVHVPDDGVLYTGDILFIGGTPIVWEGPVDNWIRACEWIEAQELEAIVPGHGPITDRAGVRAVREYLAFLQVEARKRFDAGMSAPDAARDIALGEFGSWGEAERVAVNVDTLYAEFDPTHERANVVELFTRMAELAR